MKYEYSSTKNKLWLKTLPRKVRLLMPTIGRKSLGGSIGRAGEPFDPKAFDGDMDALVQEGTPWERPATPSVPKGARNIVKPSIMPVELEGMGPTQTLGSSRSTRGSLNLPEPLPPPAENDAYIDESAFNFIDSLHAIVKKSPSKLGLRKEELDTLDRLNDRDPDTELWESIDFLDNETVRSELKKYISNKIGAKFAEKARDDDDFLQSLLLSSIAPRHAVWSDINEALKSDDIEEKRQKLRQLLAKTMDEVTPSQKKFINETIEWLSDKSKKKSESFNKNINTLANQKASEYIGEWANSSNNSPRAMALQRAAVEEFGLVDGSYYSESSITPEFGLSPLNSETMKQRTDEETEMNGTLQREFLRIQYDETQKMFQDMGIQLLSVGRGMNIPSNSPLIKSIESNKPDWKENNVGVEQQLTLRPLSSWATKSWEAMKFATPTEDSESIFAVANVPAEQVLSLSTTGLGCLPEWEAVLIGAPVNARIFNIPEGVNVENAETWINDPASYENDLDFQPDSFDDDEDDDADYQD